MRREEGWNWSREPSLCRYTSGVEHRLVDAVRRWQAGPTHYRPGHLMLTGLYRLALRSRSTLAANLWVGGACTVTLADVWGVSTIHEPRVEA